MGVSSQVVLMETPGLSLADIVVWQFRLTMETLQLLLKDEILYGQAEELWGFLAFPAQTKTSNVMVIQTHTKRETLGKYNMQIMMH